MAAGVGMELSLIKYTLAMFLMYPLAAILRVLPGTTVKHAFSAVVGIVAVQWIFEGDWIHSMASAVGTYLICLLAPKKSVGLLSFVWVMGYMTLSHWYRMHVSYMSGVFDFTGTQMVLTMKLTSFAWNYWDGTADRAAVFSDKDEKTIQRNKERRRLAITELPGPLEFLGYVFCFTCLLAGPAFEFKDYASAIDGSAYVFNPAAAAAAADKKDKKDESKLPSSSSSSTTTTAPSSVLPALTSLGVGLLCLVLKLTVGASLPLVTSRSGGKNMVPYDMEPTISSAAYLAAYPHPLRRLAQVLALLLVERWKYYFAWKVAEGSCQLAGFGFEGFDPATGRAKGWGGVTNIDIFSFETSWSIASLSRAWNKGTQRWLALYTYSRTGNSLLITYFVSAFWHGLYPGFYIFFMSLPLVTECERLARQKLNPIFIPTYDHKEPWKSFPYDFKSIVYATASYVTFFPLMNYLVSTFALGSLENCHRALSSYWYAPNILLVLYWLFLLLLPAPKSLKKKE